MDGLIELVGAIAAWLAGPGALWLAGLVGPWRDDPRPPGVQEDDDVRWSSRTSRGAQPEHEAERASAPPGRPPARGH